MDSSLIDELDATFRELDRLAAQREQAQLRERALLRLEYLIPLLGTTLDDLRGAHQALSNEVWRQLCATIQREQPPEFQMMERALTAGDDDFLNVVQYLGFVRGMTTACHQGGRRDDEHHIRGAPSPSRYARSAISRAR